MINEISGILFIDDLFRKDNQHSRIFIHSVVLEPLCQGLGIEPPNKTPYLSDSIVEKLLEIGESKDWKNNYFSISPAAQSFLISNIPDKTLVVGYEMAPWLIGALDQNNIPRIDLRISPIRFSRDLIFNVYINFTANQNLNSYKIKEKELKIEAGMMSACIAHNNFFERKFKFNSQPLIFIGQTKEDASKLTTYGHFASIEQFEKQIKEQKNKSIYYKPHPYSKDFALREKNALELLLKKKIPFIKEDIYSLLSVEDEIDFLSISSGVCIEAPFFKKSATSLFQPWIYNRCTPHETEITIKAKHFLSPRFWAILFNRHEDHEDLSETSENMFRALHNSWWGYADYKYNNDIFMKRFLKNEIKNQRFIKRLFGLLKTWRR